MTRLEIVTIGDELLLGFTIDTNAAYLARQLAALGIEVVRRATVGDDATAIAAAVGEALDRTGAVITTGGLGPTSDDLTKPAIAALFGRTMRLDEPHLAWMRERWRTLFRRELPDSNIQQAMVPEGARLLSNRHGSAPGIWLEDDQGRWVVMLPGVPREMRGMADDTIVPALRERIARTAATPRVVRSRTLRTTGISESLLADRVAPLVASLGELSLAYLPGGEGVDLRLTSRRRDAGATEAALTHASALLRVELGDYVYGEDDSDLAGVVLELCRHRGHRIAVAESCTGGLLGARLTAIAGSSDVVIGGVIAYADAMKSAHLEVPATDIDAHGAVSERVVRAMATGVCRFAGTSVGIAITGVAGPSGGTPDKPVGTVWIAASVAGVVDARRLGLVGDRDEIRRRSTQAALDLVRRMVMTDGRPDAMADPAGAAVAAPGRS